jgi:hypothetical protein
MTLWTNDPMFPEPHGILPHSKEHFSHRRPDPFYRIVVHN